MSGSQDSGTCVFDFKTDGDDDGFIDDFVQEQSSEVHSMCSLFASFQQEWYSGSVWRPKLCQGSFKCTQSNVDQYPSSIPSSNT